MTETRSVSPIFGLTRKHIKVCQFIAAHHLFTFSFIDFVVEPGIIFTESMRVLIINIALSRLTFHNGLGYLMAFLKKKGYKIEFLSLRTSSFSKISFVVKNFKPDVAFISVTSDAFHIAKQTTKILSDFSISVFWGGSHPTVRPTECISIDGVKGVCIGEGEFASDELLSLMQNSSDYSKVKNFWIKDDKVIYKNELRPPILDIDILPFPSYEYFSDILPEPWKGKWRLPVIFSRGCPRACPYCGNQALKEKYSGTGKWYRKHSPEYAFELVKEFLKIFPQTSHFVIADDTFIDDIKWLEKFMDSFSKLGIEYSCQCYPEDINEDNLKILSQTHCTHLGFGIESGSEELRKLILKRPYSNTEIIEKATLIRKYGIKIVTRNMVGLPYESTSDIQKTININRKIKAEYPFVTIFNPYPGSRLGDFCERMNWINKSIIVRTNQERTKLKSPFISPFFINFYHNFFTISVRDKKIIRYVKAIIIFFLTSDSNYLFRLVNSSKFLLIKIRIFLNRIFYKKNKVVGNSTYSIYKKLGAYS